MNEASIMISPEAALRMQCLEIAAGTQHGFPVSDVLSSAQKMYDFVRGVSPTGDGAKLSDLNRAGHITRTDAAA